MTRALVIGMGKSGLSLARHFARAGAPALVVDDRAKPPLLAEFESGFGSDSGIEWKIDDWKQWDESRFAGFRPIAASPGVSPTAVRAPREKITNDAALFFAARAREYPRSKLLAVTGTNGKSSLAALCEHLCRKCGRRAQAVGNIGYPFLDALADWARAGEAPHIIVAELSSFQLEIAGGGGGADCATILNLAPDHIDRHGGFAAYAAAKRLVYRGCGGVALNIDEADATDAPTTAAVEKFSTAPDAPDDCWSARGGFVRRGEDKWISRAQLSPSLRANPQTAVAALAMLSLLDLPRVARAAICEGLADFPGLPHRLREVARRADGVSFIDDSKATNVAAAIFALRATPHASAMIVGGAGKGQDFSLLAAAIAARQKAAALAVFVVGEAGPDLAAAFAANGARFDCADSVAAATMRASCAVGGGGAVLLSPACASTDSFVDFAARGIAFQTAAREAAAASGGGSEGR